MPETQPSLFDARPETAAETDVQWLETLLDSTQTWMTAAELLQAIGKPPNDDHKRWVRDVASKSGYTLSGQKGYRHLQHASPDEIHHACAWMESQAKVMGERATRLRRNAHKLFA